MEQKHSTWLDHELIEIDSDGSQPIQPRRAVFPPVSKEKQEFLNAINQFQRRYTGRSLSWGEIFDVLVSLGYRKVEQSAKPLEANGSPQDPSRPDAAGNETPT